MTQQQKQQGRRHFLQQAAGAAATTGVLSFWPQAFAQKPPEATTGRALGQLSMAEMSRRLAAGSLSSSQLVEEALAAIQNPAGEGARTFIRVHADSARATAARASR